MKKVMFLMAVAGMFAFAACNNNTENAEVIDTPAIEEPVVEEPVMDSAAVEAVAEEVAAEVAE
ncbi:MAG: hypothetical protein MJZ77_05120 [Bacteroidales bacterium]|nr:hypothetical protein [Bacteroidales bacterium]